MAASGAEKNVGKWKSGLLCRATRNCRGAKMKERKECQEKSKTISIHDDE